MRTDKLVAPLALILVFAPVYAMGASSRPHIELRPVVECTGAPDETRSLMPQSRGKCISPEVIVSDAAVIGATHGQSRLTGDVLNIILSDEGRDRIYKFSLDHVRKQIAIVIDGAVVSTPFFIEPIDSNAMEVNGLPVSQIDEIVARMKAPRDRI